MSLVIASRALRVYRSWQVIRAKEGTGKMRVCLIEVGHWHAPYYYAQLAAQGIAVAAVSDGAPAVAARVGHELGCPSYTDYALMLEREAPDFVLAFGRHNEMAAIAHHLLDRKVPFGMEKPLGLSSAEVAPLAEQARRQGAFVAVPLTFRATSWVRKIRELEAPGSDIAFLGFRFMTGPVSRYYTAGCEWILTRAGAGGGCTLNLGIHFTDLFAHLTGKRPTRLWASMNSRTNHTEVEDYSLMIMEAADGTACRIETGYPLPGGAKGRAMECVVRGGQGYYEVREDEMLWVDRDARTHHIPGPTDQTSFYPLFVRDCLDALREGRPPVAGIHDNLAALQLVEAAYRGARTKQVVELL
jgi:predicted dehydrogenase